MTKVTVKRGVTAPVGEAEKMPDTETSGAAPGDKYAPDAKGVIRFEDSTGRTIGVKKPNPLERVRLAEILGESASNQVVMLSVMPAYYVIELDGEMSPRVRSRRELDAMLLRLGDEGIDAVEAYIMEDLAPKIKAAMDEQARLQADEEDRAATKK
jgi:hypothetical protein